MFTQGSRFRRIRREINRIGRTAAKDRITIYMEDLYSVDLDGDVYFYAQDADGFPTGIIDTDIAGTRFQPTMVIRNTFDAAAWENIERPEHYRGHFSQPLTRSHLTGCSSSSEECGECDDNNLYDDKDREDVYFRWTIQKHNIWFQNIDIRLAEHTGYGLYARNPLPEGIFIGEYAGELVPIDDSIPNELTVYQFGIGIGQRTVDDALQPMAWIDATRQGSIFRFMAHSCEPNAQVRATRVGMHNRILAVYTTRPIAANEPITIDYGTDWFTGENCCFCGTASCKNRPPLEDSENEDSELSDYLEIDTTDDDSELSDYPESDMSMSEDDNESEDEE